MNSRGFPLFLLIVLAGCEQSSPPGMSDPGAATDQRSVIQAEVNVVKPASQGSVTHQAEVDAAKPADQGAVTQAEVDAARSPDQTRGARQLVRMQKVLDLADEQKAEILSMAAAGANHRELLSVLSDNQRDLWKAHVASRKEQRKSPEEVIARWQGMLVLDPAQVEEMHRLLSQGAGIPALRAVLTPEQVKQLKQIREQEKSAAAGAPKE